HNMDRAIIAPAMISTGEIAAIHLAEGELELAVGTTVLQGAESTVRAAIEHHRGIPKPDLDRLSWSHGMIVLDGVPVIGVQPSGAGLLTPVAPFLETGKCPSSVGGV